MGESMEKLLVHRFVQWIDLYRFLGAVSVGFFNMFLCNAERKKQLFGHMLKSKWALLGAIDGDKGAKFEIFKKSKKNQKKSLRKNLDI